METTVCPIRTAHVYRCPARAAGSRRCRRRALVRGRTESRARVFVFMYNEMAIFIACACARVWI